MRDSSYTVSVIMPIYNGEKNIIEQLESIRNQERMPDEVLLCDDGSTDSTVEIVRNFIEKHQLTGWQLLINEENIGWRKNFIRLIHQATGDVIFSVIKMISGMRIKLNICQKKSCLILKISKY
ncbi:glycosyltransferase [Enterococcus faecium]|nr:glycosyltransferase [Enterococcus faecium]